AGEGAEPLLQVGRVLRLRPDARRIAAVLVGDDGGELPNAGGHRTGEAVDGRLLTETRLEICRGKALRFERPDALLQDVRPDERLLNRHLLVDREADEQRKRICR